MSGRRSSVYSHITSCSAYVLLSTCRSLPCGLRHGATLDLARLDAASVDVFFQLLSEMLAKLESASAAIRRAASSEVTALLSVR